MRNPRQSGQRPGTQHVRQIRREVQPGIVQRDVTGEGPEVLVGPGILRLVQRGRLAPGLHEHVPRFFEGHTGFAPITNPLSPTLTATRWVLPLKATSKIGLPAPWVPTLVPKAGGGNRPEAG